MKTSSESWDESRQAELIAQIVNGELSLEAACERHALVPDTLRRWVPIFRHRMLRELDQKLQQASLIQTLNAERLGNATYTGSVEDIPLPDLMQTCQMGGKDAVITVTRDGQRSSIWFEKGAVVDAESGRLCGEAAVYRILGFESGQVSADFRSEPREATIELPCNFLLLEAVRHKDERVRLLEQLDGPLSIYRPAPGAWGADTTLTEREVMDLCDGERAVRDVLAASERADLDTVSSLVRLVQRGYLVRDGVSTPPPARVVLAALDDAATESRGCLALEQNRHAAARSRRRGLLLAGVGLVMLAMLGWRATGVMGGMRTILSSTAGSIRTMFGVETTLHAQ